MKDTISNKTLVVLLIVAIGISVLGIWVSVSKQQSVYLSGAATSQSGTLQITVGGYAALSMANQSISLNVSCDTGTDTVTLNTSNFLVNGSGTYVDGLTTTADGYLTCKIGEASNCNCTATITNTSMVLSNSGNELLNVTVNGSTAANFIGGTSPSLRYWTTDNEVGSCTNGYDASPTELSNTLQQACGCIQPADANDQVNVFWAFTVPSDSTTGTTLTNTVEFQAAVSVGATCALS